MDHAETRWLALRFDDDVKELRPAPRQFSEKQTDHRPRFDSIDTQLRSLTQMSATCFSDWPEPDDKAD